MKVACWRGHSLHLKDAFRLCIRFQGARPNDCAEARDQFIFHRGEWCILLLAIGLAHFPQVFWAPQCFEMLQSQELSFQLLHLVELQVGRELSLDQGWLLYELRNQLACPLGCHGAFLPCLWDENGYSWFAYLICVFKQVSQQFNCPSELQRSIGAKLAIHWWWSGWHPSQFAL